MELSLELALSVDVVSPFLLNIGLLDLCLHDMHLQRVKREQYKEKLNI